MSVSGGLTACSGNTVSQSWFAPDPQLQDNSAALEPSPSPSPATRSIPQEIKDNRLPPNFPETIPIYQQAKLVESQYRVGEIKGETRWQTEADRETVSEFYRQELENRNWAIDTAESNNDLAIASLEDLQIKLSILPESEDSSGTIFLIEYEVESPGSEITETTAEAETTGTKPAIVPEREKVEISANLERVSPQVRGYIEDLAALGILPENFDPDRAITRREYSRWLFEAHNQLYRDRPTKQIRPVASASQPAFGDVKEGDRDFAIIQGLAEAGIIPSRLNQDTEALLFQPDAPLTRETLILWKVPLDIRKGLPTASIEAVQKTWGFQDTEKIDPKVLKALFSDFENGENANILRAFGYTTLLQPKKSVTNAEAAASLWYFGYQGEGISAREILVLENSQSENSE
ncbi:MAG: S-layer homology domain-containing protein [Cyanobacteria bacterium P01_E01_bin.42]